jgi:cytochrome c-type biogenesis protein CcmE
MKVGQIVAVVLALLGLGVVVSAFLLNASPYVGIVEAKGSHADNLHVIADLKKETVRTTGSDVSFIVTDADGNQMPVAYHGAPPGNMGEATQIVVVGGMKGDTFVARQLILKCPSKYKKDDKPRV